MIRRSAPVIAVAIVVALLAVGLASILISRQDSGTDATRGAAEQEGTQQPAVEPAPMNRAIGASQRYDAYQERLAQATAKLRQNGPVKASANRVKGTSNAIDPFANNPYKGNTTPAPACPASSVGAGDLQRGSGTFFVAGVDGSNKRVEIPVAPDSLCALSISGSGQDVKLIPGVGQRIYVYAGDIRTAQTISPLEYSRTRPNQEYSVNALFGNKTPQQVYLRAVPSPDVVRASGSCTYCDFSGAEFPAGYTFAGSDFSNSDFSGAMIYGVEFTKGTKFVNSHFGQFDGVPPVMASVKFGNSNLSGATFDGVVFDNSVDMTAASWVRPAEFKNSVLQFPGTAWTGRVKFEDSAFMVSRSVAKSLAASAISVQLINSVFVGSTPNFSDSTWTSSDISRSNLGRVKFDGATLTNVTGHQTKLRGASGVAARFNGADLRGSDFSRSTLTDVDFTNAKVGALPSTADSKGDGPGSFRRADIRGGNFSGADLGGVDFTEAYLIEGAAPVKLSGAVLSRAVFSGAILGGADFSNSTVTNAEFADAQCIGCVFTKADLSGSNFSDSYLFGSDLTNTLKMDGINLRNSLCCSTEKGAWKLVLGAGATGTSPQYKPTSLDGAKLGQSGVCPSGNIADSKNGCKGNDRPGVSPIVPPPCTAAANYWCAADIGTIAGIGRPGYGVGAPLPPPGVSPTPNPSGPSEQDVTKAMFNAPTRVATSNGNTAVAQSMPTANLLITDQKNHVVRAMDTTLASKDVPVVAGTPKVSGFGGDGGPATAAKLNAPTGVVADAFGRVYIADTGNNRIRRVNSDGTIQTIAGTGTAGFSGDRGLAVKAKVSAPQGVAVACSTPWPADCEVFIADTGNNRIRKIDNRGKITTVVGTGVSGKTGDTGDALAATLNAPTDVEFDPNGNVNLVDSGNGSVRYVNAADNKIYTLVGGLSKPTDMAIDPNGLTYVAASGTNQVFRYDLKGDPMPGLVVNKAGIAGFDGDGSDSLLGAIKDAKGIVPLGDNETFFIADTDNNRIRSVYPQR